MNIQNINRLNNEYRAYIYEAESHRITRAGVASREEGLSYQRAAQICGQLASMTTGSEAQYWVDNQSRCEAKMRQIWAELNPREPVKETPAAKPAARPAAKKTDVPQETVDHWYKPDPGYGFDQVSGMEEVKHLLSDCVRDIRMDALNEYMGVPTVQSFFFYGPPGCGKTFIIKAFAHELMQQGYKFMSLSSADIHSKFSGEADKIVERAFKEAVDNAPCILFMDEAPEFSARTLQTLREPLESGYVAISRAKGTTYYPARFQLIMAANPCPCGYAYGNGERCTCREKDRVKYFSRLSGPILDRIDIQIEVPPVERISPGNAPSGDSSHAIRLRVIVARQMAQERFREFGWCCNAQATGTWLRANTSPKAIELVNRALASERLSLRGADRAMRLAWTLSDLAGKTSPGPEEMMQGISMRTRLA